MSQPLIATSGYSTDAVEQIYSRAQEISGRQAAKQGFVPPLLDVTTQSLCSWKSMDLSDKTATALSHGNHQRSR